MYAVRENVIEAARNELASSSTLISGVKFLYSSFERNS